MYRDQVRDGCSSGEGRFYLARGLRVRAERSRVQGTTEVAPAQTTDLSKLALTVAAGAGQAGR